jgi:hypothetical protein
MGMGDSGMMAKAVPWSLRQKIIERATNGEPLNGLKSDAAARCTAKFSRITAKCAAYVERVNHMTNPAHFPGDVVTLRCTCNAENKAVTRCANIIIDRDGDKHSEVRFTCQTCHDTFRIRNKTFSPTFQEAVESKGLELVHLRLCPASAATKAAVDPNKRVLFEDAVCLN